MQIVKRNGKIVEFDANKIKVAIQKANREVEEKEKATDAEIEQILAYIIGLKKKRLLVEDVQDIIEERLMMFKHYDLAKRYIIYRYTHELVRRSNTTDLAIKELINGESEYWNTENSKKNAHYKNIT